MWWRRPRSGPDRAHAPAARPGVGFTSPVATGYRFTRAGTRDLSAAFPEVVGTRVSPGDELRYAILPEWVDEDRCALRTLLDRWRVGAGGSGGGGSEGAGSGAGGSGGAGSGRRRGGADDDHRVTGVDTSPTAPTTGTPTSPDPDISTGPVTSGAGTRPPAGAGWPDGFASDAVAVDLVFTDGGRLSDLPVVDQYGVPLDPAAQHVGAMAHPDQWHLVRVALDAAVGRTVARVEFVFADPRHRPRSTSRRPSRRAVTGWVDAVTVAPSPPLPGRPVEWARTRQGTHSSDRVSRGGSAPSVGVPHAFVSGIPVTNAGEIGWPYAWHADNGPDNRPALQAFATSHLPSPWMGERGAFQIMPALVRADGTVAGSPSDRALSFDRDGESAHPHHYRVALDGGIEAELTATDHVVLMRFRFPEGASEGVLVFDQIRGDGELQLPDADASASDAMVTALTRDERSVGVDRAASPPYHLHAAIDRPVTASGMLPRFGAGPVRGWLRVALGPDRTVIVRAATSAISTAQAARNIERDGADADFDAVAGRAAAAWDDWISRVEFEGATPEQRAVLATCLYRVGLFPRRGHEDLGTADAPAPHYASPFDPAAPVVAGELSVDQGFWDVYRTAWPLYALLEPALSARLLDGFVEHYRSGGWTSRWSAPGPIDSMTGTSSDVVFAQAVDAGIPTRIAPPDGPDDHRLDLWSAYDSALRNATVPSDAARVGRKGLARSIFRGFVDTRVHEGLSWTLDAALGDLAVAQLARALADRVGAEHPRAAELDDAAAYFTARSGAAAASFDESVHAFQGRRPDGQFRRGPEDYDPEVWGHDYTETNGWGTAFSAPHDGAGLVTLHGGPAAFAAHLERMLATPARATWALKGSYPAVIHEMVEARNLRFGQWAPSNQPAHHIPFMAYFAGRPDLAQRLVHEAATRLFGGGEIGQGWPGDEDNGEMSAWWIFAALGLYPLVPGTAGYVLTAPIVPHVCVQLGGGRTLTIEAPGAGRDKPYISSVTIDGRPWASTFVPHAVLAAGATVRVELAAEPQAWGADAAAQPPSLTPPGARPVILRDLTDDARVAAVIGGRRVDAGPVLDDDSRTSGLRFDVGDAIEVVFDHATAPEFLTLTPADAGTVAFRLERDAGASAAVVREGEEPFRWPRQTRPFVLDPAPSTRWRWVAEAPVELVQFELLGRAPVPRR